MTVQPFRLLIAGTLLGSILNCPVLADSLLADAANSSEAVAIEVGATPFDRAAIDNQALDAYRGGAELQVLNSSALDGVVSDNQAYNLTTGSNLVTEGSFSGLSGISTVVQNTGNNVLIQNSTIVNIQVK